MKSTVLICTLVVATIIIVVEASPSGLPKDYDRYRYGAYTGVHEDDRWSGYPYWIIGGKGRYATFGNLKNRYSGFTSGTPAGMYAYTGLTGGTENRYAYAGLNGNPKNRYAYTGLTGDSENRNAAYAAGLNRYAYSGLTGDSENRYAYAGLTRSAKDRYPLGQPESRAAYNPYADRAAPALARRTAGNRYRLLG